jgi:predicted site-specific integrase-resolvase
MRAKDIINKYGITRNTLTNWVKTNKIGFSKTKTGRYIYNDNDIKPVKRKNIIYGRVSTTGQKENLNRQVERLENFCSSNGYIIDDIFTEIASGMNYNRKNFVKLLNSVLNNEIENIFVEYEDRLVRFGFDNIVNICKNFNTNIIVINKSENNDQVKEITDDLISIIHHFSSKIYSLRKNKNKIINIVNEE